MNPRPATSANPRRLELACVVTLLIVFACFTWRGLTMFFSDDDMLNMYYAWMTPALKLWTALLLPWTPVSRPLGNAVYRAFYDVFGFHPLSLYIFCWLLLIANVIAAWRFFRTVAPSVFVALMALSLTLVHGLFEDLYLSAGTIYDRLCFLFTVLAVTVYAGVRRDENGLLSGRVALLCFLCLMAMNSKESGAAVSAILFCYECVYCLPEMWRKHRLRHWIRSIALFYCLMAGLLAAFVLGRVHRINGLLSNPAYRPHLSFHFWLTNVAEYLSIIVYRRVHFDGNMAAIALLAMLALAAALSNRAMLFGWLYFVIAITPVALISPRPGYVLYVPIPGLGLYFAALLGLAFGMVRNPAPRDLSYAQTAVVALVTALMTWIHATHWPEPWVVRDSPEWRIADKMTRDYPTLKPGARILFADDYPSNNPWDLLFNLRLLYRDPLIEVSRLKGIADQQPDRSLSEYDYLFTTGLDTYLELDRHNPEESVRLNILRDYPPGRSFDFARADHAGYTVSGILSCGREVGCWTTRSAKLKFAVSPVDSTLTLKFWVPDYVSAGVKRNLSVIVGGETIGIVALAHPGENNAAFPVSAHAMNPSGFTILELNVDSPYVKDGQEYGVVLLRAAFGYKGPSAQMR